MNTNLLDIIEVSTKWKDATHCCACNSEYEDNPKPWRLSMRNEDRWIGPIAACDKCAEQIQEHNKALRQAELDALPRCECSGCTRRGRWRLAHGVLMCGVHKSRLQKAHGKAMGAIGGLGLFMPWPWDREDMLRMATSTA